ncbi:MAG: NUDIX hydrolase [Flavobacteriales bacterium]
MMLTDGFSHVVERRLEGLESMATHANQIIGYPRPSPEEARAMDPPARESAVIFPLFRRNNQWHTAFMKRPSGQGVHSDQLSFPGGRLEPGETHLQAALREAHEEVGVPPHQWELLGELSALYIPPSHFVVQPFIAIGPENPIFSLNESEVVQWIEYPIVRFLDGGIISKKPIFVSKYERTFESGYFDINGHTLWGATAIMVQEFRSLFGLVD